ncbi:barstar family protein [Bacillus subtilis]|uniref:Putative ribonuclease inhibitor YrdF n=3 Tax=Bacillus subtilis subsp. subtilis TaxID=135461 RepID=YRDF_BACSU|nr:MULTISPECIES: barstar family protein [Bacillales]NP_390550.1 putative ribonuclease inhibitor [Bacillus subtilis subsp. subtilis str. 168]O07938.1 RecName: Full=Putative ribonuclease inhibitor YrdF [Bacillus subtilis subsp. subtilis str. 168]MBW4823905.1 barstar family protein [Bacillaceae bacterium]BAM53098.1 ribonuclease inhibitor [Bacillus subtilis BEST7613]AAB80899.1 ribonuclease inhibitor [Bacillus subtilis subsp. subtilis str. 168]AFQ58515.1 Putative ribonuclease inhibitor [Bacillus s
MRKIIIDGRDFENIEVLHDDLKDKLDFPDYYGRNLDALWDCLTGWVDLPLTLVLKNFEFSNTFLGSYADDVLEVIQEAQEELKDEFKIIIE